jgi:hypothetical protein
MLLFFQSECHIFLTINLTSFMGDRQQLVRGPHNIVGPQITNLPIFNEGINGQ